MKPVSFVIVGSGWRAMFYVRIARRYPELFQLKYVLCRSKEKAARIRQECGVPATTSVADCEASRPDFVVVAVSFDSNYEVTKEWLLKGYAVLAETPAAASEEALEDLWALHLGGARLQIAEQYFRYPLMAAGLRAVEQGLLGDTDSVELSLAHDYHGASLIRRMLGCGLNARGAAAGAGGVDTDCCPDRESPAPASGAHTGNGIGTLPAMKLCGRQYVSPVTETDSRFGPVTDGSIRQWTRDRVTIEFANGKVAFYDFSSVQYHSFIRSRHINVRGPRGEWNDTLLRYLDDAGRPVKEELKAYLNPAYSALDTGELVRLSGTWHPEVHMENLQDEYAIATLMLDMRGLLENGKEGYPLAEALEDSYTLLLIREATKHPGRLIESRPHTWQKP